MEWKTLYVLPWESTIMNLRDFSMFNTMGEVGHCTKFLISCFHNGSLWLDKEYLIHMDDTHELTCLSMDNDDVTKRFQGSRKRDNNKGETSLYDRFNT